MQINSKILLQHTKWLEMKRKERDMMRLGMDNQIQKTNHHGEVDFNKNSHLNSNSSSSSMVIVDSIDLLTHLILMLRKLKSNLMSFSRISLSILNSSNRGSKKK
jgi:hypothetical protein